MRYGDMEDLQGDFTHGQHLQPPPALLLRSIPAAVGVDHEKEAPAPTQAVQHGVDPGDILLCDLGNKALMVEDLQNALRLWTRPVVLIAGRNSLDRLPMNVPATILYLDLSWNRCVRWPMHGQASLPRV